MSQVVEHIPVFEFLVFLIHGYYIALIILGEHLIVIIRVEGPRFVIMLAVEVNLLDFIEVGRNLLLLDIFYIGNGAKLVLFWA